MIGLVNFAGGSITGGALPLVARRRTAIVGAVSQFKFFMAFYSLLLGLGVTQLLGGFANLLRAPTRPAIGWLRPLTGALLLAQIMSSFFDAFAKLQHARLDFVGLGLPTLIGMLYFACAVIVVPAGHDHCPSLDDYFFRQRRWTIGGILLANLATIAIELPLVAHLARAGQTFEVTYYGVVNALPLASLAWATVARSRSVVRAILAVNIVVLIWLYSPFSFALHLGG